MPERQVALSGQKEQPRCEQPPGHLRDAVLSGVSKSRPKEPVLTPPTWDSAVGAATPWAGQRRQRWALSGADPGEAGEKFRGLVMLCTAQGTGCRSVSGH